MVEEVVLDLPVTIQSGGPPVYQHHALLESFTLKMSCRDDRGYAVHLNRRQRL